MSTKAYAEFYSVAKDETSLDKIIELAQHYGVEAVIIFGPDRTCTVCEFPEENDDLDDLDELFEKVEKESSK